MVALTYAWMQCGICWAEPMSDPEPSRSTVVMLPLQVEGSLGDADRVMLSDSLLRGLQRGAFDVVSRDDGARCEAETCWQELESTGIAFVVEAHLSVVERDYAIDVELYDVQTRTAVATSRETCEICGIADVASLTEAAAATLRTKVDALVKGPATLGVHSNPEGAIVTLDGEIVGTTPLVGVQVESGAHDVKATKDGYLPVEQRVTFVDGVAESLDFMLQPDPNGIKRWRPWAWASLGVGLASLGTAIAFGALRDRPYRLGGACADDRVDEEGNCERLWNTEWHVFGFASAGAALVTLGTVILIRTRDRVNQRTAWRVSPTGVTFSTRF